MKSWRDVIFASTSAKYIATSFEPIFRATHFTATNAKLTSWSFCSRLENERIRYIDSEDTVDGALKDWKPCDLQNL